MEVVDDSSNELGRQISSPSCSRGTTLDSVMALRSLPARSMQGGAAKLTQGLREAIGLLEDAMPTILNASVHALNGVLQATCEERPWLLSMLPQLPSPTRPPLLKAIKAAVRSAGFT